MGQLNSLRFRSMNVIVKLEFLLIVSSISFTTATNVHSQQWSLEFDLVTISQPVRWQQTICFAGTARKEHSVRIYFVDLQTGELIRSHAIEAVRGPFLPMDLRATPSISKTNVAFSFASGLTVSFTMRNGVPELAWRFDLRENFNCTLTPFARTAIGSPGITLTQYDGMYFVPTGKISSEKHSVPTLVCLDSSTGILKWTHTLSKKDAKYPTAAGPMEAQAQLWFQDGDGRIKSISTKTGVEEYASDEVGFSWFPPIATQGQLLFVRDSELTGISGKRGLFSLSLATRIGKNIKFPGTEIRPAVFSSGYFLTDPFGQITQYHSDDGSVGPYMWTMRGLAGAK